MQSVLFSIRSKGLKTYLKRGQTIGHSYGLGPQKMWRALDVFCETLRPFNCPATFPITAVAVQRHPHGLQRYIEQNIEFAVHGLRHIDYSQLTAAQQRDHLRQTQLIFTQAGLSPAGFRSPYLQFNRTLHAALQEFGFSYVSNQPLWWDAVDPTGLPPTAAEAYRRAMAFYNPHPAAKTPSLPTLTSNFVEIPVSLPDDEILLDRLRGDGAGLAAQVWTHILRDTHRRGELFTLQLHPERITRCADDLSMTLTHAQTLTPSVWLARLDEIADWWRNRTAAAVTVESVAPQRWQIAVSGPPGLTALLKDVPADGPTSVWRGAYRQAAFSAGTVTVAAPNRPVVGASPVLSAKTVSLLRQYGYIVEINASPADYSIYLPGVSPADGPALVETIESHPGPLVKLARWPNAAASALAVTGDIDALTLWDYGLKYVGQ